ncbi:hypothetical protein PbJCM13498_10160 [Prolixibacter bellariivorans]|uniref:Secretion system C-terminal sorting domain-containing protein n=1 Tax=Prolixibacter bellariivorans TaxID=314319 RepID=A0A5M4AX11_9BACT|nr:T9SS type A sorting domain-containing protein [Prolixibacter bellariivorans]GET32153.1 hypothetical protein PbJCM13498_10160 [Prolixibacter bellariivorans]
MKVKMFNIDGEVLFLKKISTKNLGRSQSREENKIKNLKKGIYFLHYDFETSHFTKKVVIS